MLKSFMFCLVTMYRESHSSLCDCCCIPFQPPPTLPFDPINVADCGNTKGCYRNPPECEEPACDIIVAWENRENSIVFEMSADSDGWVALALSHDKKMVQWYMWSADFLPLGQVKPSF